MCQCVLREGEKDHRIPCVPQRSPHPHSTRPGYADNTSTRRIDTFLPKTNGFDKESPLTVMLANVPPQHDAHTYLASVYPTMAASWQLPSAIRLSTQLCQDMFEKLVLGWKTALDESSLKTPLMRRIHSEEAVFIGCLTGPPASRILPAPSRPVFLLVRAAKRSFCNPTGAGCSPSRIPPPGRCLSSWNCQLYLHADGYIIVDHDGGL